MLYLLSTATKATSTIVREQTTNNSWTSRPREKVNVYMMTCLSVFEQIFVFVFIAGFFFLIKVNIDKDDCVATGS